MPNQTKEEAKKTIDKENEDTETPSSEDVENAGEGVDVSEEYQKKVHELTHKANKHELKHLHSKAYDREDELRREENKKAKDGEKSGEFNDSEMPLAD